MKKLKNKLKYFFKELFKDELGTYNPEAEKVTKGSVLYFIIGGIFAVIIPFCLLWITCGEVTFNPYRIFTDIDSDLQMYRYVILIAGILGNILFLFWGFFTTYRVNNDFAYLKVKRACKLISIICFIFEMISFAMACIVYYW